MRPKLSPVRLTKAVIAAAALNMAIVAGASGMDVVSEPNISTKAAMKIVKKAVKICKQDGFNVSAAVVDASGVLIAQLRDNDAGPHTTSSAFRKAFTAASLRRATGELAELAVNVPTTAGLQHMNDNMLLLQGGLPIVVDGEVVGGVGVGGAPGGQFDEACALGAINSDDDSDD
jgi:uncharacterized protein GlcG (DUF336 family)